jgi:hypothetical protein
MGIKLTPDQDVCIGRMLRNAAALQSTAEVQLLELAKLKARCEEFLAFPLVQALNSEGL